MWIDHDLLVITALVREERKHPKRLRNDKNPRKQKLPDREAIVKKKEAIIESLPHLTVSGTTTWNSLNHAIRGEIQRLSRKRKRAPINQLWLDGYLDELKTMIREK